jgi:hypothetical protein
MDISDCFAVSLTLKQFTTDHERIDEISASQNFNHFQNLLNKKLFGKRFQRFGVRLNIVPVLERSQNDRWHYHAIMQCPDSKPYWYMHAQITSIWTSTKFGYNEHDIKRSIDHGWTDYITKFKRHYDEVDWVNTYWI